MDKVISFIKRINTNKESENSISFHSFIKYCENNILLIFLTFLIIIVSHGYLLFNSNVGIDTEIFLNNPQNNYNWLDIGRFGLIVEKYILNLGFFNMFYAEALAIVFLLLFNIICFYTFYTISGKNNKLLFIIFPLVGLTSPIWAEQFIFYIQIAQISFALVLTILSVLFTYKWILERNWFSCLMGILLLVLSIGTYQSLVPIYIAFSIFCLLLLFENKEYSEKKSIFYIIVQVISLFAISFVMYEIILKITKVDFSYLNGSNFWNISSSKKEVIFSIINHIKEILLARTQFYNYGFLFASIVFVICGIVNSIHNEKITTKVYKVLYFLCYLAFLSTPFLMTIYLGQGSVVRAEIYLPLVEAMIIMFAVENMFKIFKSDLLRFLILVPVIYIVFVQSFYLESLYYTDHLTREKDKEYIYQLAHDLKEAGVPDTATLFIYGHFNGMETPATTKGQVIGTSMFEFNHTIYPMYYYSGQTVVYLFRAYGFNYNWLPIEKIDQARDKVSSEEYPCWPKEGYITKSEEDDYYTIKINMY